LYETENSAIDVLSEASEKLQDLTKIDNQFNSYKKECESAKIIVEEISKFVQSYNSNIEFNPERLEEVRTRLAQLSGLKKKYGSTIEDILSFSEKIEQELFLIENLDESISQIQQKINEDKSKFSELCIQLSEQRKQTAQKLESTVVDVLSQLGMVSAKFKINFEQTQDTDGLVSIESINYKATSTGVDSVEFYISTNPGEELKPLAKIASGGEISRIMLALKSALAEADKVPVLIFDEIDKGISGRIAQAVGKSLKDLAKTHQIICITHLPQIASMGDHHFVIEKYSEGNTTYTNIRKVKDDERALEIAKLLSGKTITEAHIQGAQELIEQANNF
jgi:DNA repair protein RecN (Recombination protein N)